MLSLPVDIMCETLHHLNDLHAKCCKHWFFEVIFDYIWTHIGRYLSHNLTWMLVFRCSKVKGLSAKKFKGVKSHDLSIQLISASNCAGRKCLLQYSHISSSCVACGTVSKSYSLYDRNPPNWLWLSFHRRFRRSKVQSHLRTKEWLFRDLMASL